MQTPEQPPTPPAGDPSAGPVPPPSASAPAAGVAAPVNKPGQHGLAIAGFVCGLVGVLTEWCGIGVPLCILGIIFGVLGRNRNLERGAGVGLPLAGLIMGIVGLVIFVALIAATGSIKTGTS